MKKFKKSFLGLIMVYSLKKKSFKEGYFVEVGIILEIDLIKEVFLTFFVGY